MYGRTTSHIVHTARANLREREDRLVNRQGANTEEGIWKIDPWQSTECIPDRKRHPLCLHCGRVIEDCNQVRKAVVARGQDGDGANQGCYRRRPTARVLDAELLVR